MHTLLFGIGRLDLYFFTTLLFPACLLDHFVRAAGWFACMSLLACFAVRLLSVLKMNLGMYCCMYFAVFKGF